MARITPINFTLADGTPLLLRTAEPDDADALLAYMHENIPRAPFILTTPDEFTMTLDEERAFLQRSLDASADLFLLACNGPRFVGVLSFKGNTRRKIAHHGVLGMTVDYRWRGRGVGRRLIDTLIAWASTHPVLEKISLEVFADNTKAVALYRAAGFEIVGHSFAHYRQPDGSMHDHYWMERRVKP